MVKFCAAIVKALPLVIVVSSSVKSAAAFARPSSTPSSPRISTEERSSCADVNFARPCAAKFASLLNESAPVVAINKSPPCAVYSPPEIDKSAALINNSLPLVTLELASVESPLVSFAASVTPSRPVISIVFKSKPFAPILTIDEAANTAFELARNKSEAVTDRSPSWATNSPPVMFRFCPSIARSPPLVAVVVLNEASPLALISISDIDVRSALLKDSVAPDKCNKSELAKRVPSAVKVCVALRLRAPSCAVYSPPVMVKFCAAIVISFVLAP